MNLKSLSVIAMTISLFGFTIQSARAQIPVTDGSQIAQNDRNFFKDTFDKIKEFAYDVQKLEWLTKTYNTAQSTLEEATELVNQGVETLRIMGDPNRLLSELGLQDVASLVGEVQGIYDEGMELYQWGTGITALADAAASGNTGAMASLGQEIGISGRWTNLLNLRMPDDPLDAINMVDFEGYARTRDGLGRFEEARPMMAEQRQRLAQELNTTINQLSAAKTHTEISSLAAKAQQLGTALGMNSDQEMRDALALLVNDAANTSALEGRDRAAATIQARQRMESLLQEADQRLQYARTMEAAPGSIQQSRRLDGTDLFNPSRDQQFNSSQGNPIGYDAYESPTSYTGSGGWNSLPASRLSSVESRLASMPSTTKGWCGRESRKTIEMATGVSLARQNHAKHYGSSLTSAGYRPVIDSGSYLNGDTRVLQPSNSNGSGHMEVFYGGKWYSDFAQNRSSLYNTGQNKYYSSATLYRF